MISLADIAQQKPDAENELRNAAEAVALQLGDSNYSRVVAARLDGAIRELMLLHQLEIELLSTGKTGSETETRTDAARAGDAQNSHSDTRQAPTPAREAPRSAGNSLPVISANPLFNNPPFPSIS